MSDKQLIDDAFYVEESTWKTWKSFDKDGKPLVASLTSELVLQQQGFTAKVSKKDLEKVQHLMKDPWQANYE